MTFSRHDVNRDAVNSHEESSASSFVFQEIRCFNDVHVFDTGLLSPGTSLLLNVSDIFQLLPSIDFRVVGYHSGISVFLA